MIGGRYPGGASQSEKMAMLHAIIPVAGWIIQIVYGNRRAFLKGVRVFAALFMNIHE